MVVEARTSVVDTIVDSMVVDEECGEYVVVTVVGSTVFDKVVDSDVRIVDSFNVDEDIEGCVVIS